MKDLIFKILTESKTDLTEAQSLDDVFNRVRKMYASQGELKREEFDKIVALDPDTQATSHNKAGKFTMVLIDWYMRLPTIADKENFAEDLEGIPRKMMEQVVRYPKFSSMMNLQAIHSISDFVNKGYEIGIIKTADTVVGLPDEDKPEYAAKMKQASDILFEDKQWIVVHPKTYLAAQYWAGVVNGNGDETGFRWCTNRGGPSSHYSSYEKKYLIIVRKKTGGILDRAIPNRKTAEELRRYEGFQTDKSLREFKDGKDLEYPRTSFFYGKGTEGVRNWYVKKILEPEYKDKGYNIDKDGYVLLEVGKENPNEILSGFPTSRSQDNKTSSFDNWLITKKDAEKVFQYKKEGKKGAGNLFKEFGLSEDDIDDVRGFMGRFLSSELIKEIEQIYKKETTVPIHIEAPKKITRKRASRKKTTEAVLTTPEENRILSYVSEDIYIKAFVNNVSVIYETLIKEVENSIYNSDFSNFYQAKYDSSGGVPKAMIKIPAIALPQYNQVSGQTVMDRLASYGSLGKEDTGYDSPTPKPPFFTVSILSVCDVDTRGIQRDILTLIKGGSIGVDSDPNQMSFDFPESRVEKAVKMLLKA